MIAFFDDGNLFVLVQIPEFAPVIDGIVLDVAGLRFDVTAFHARFGATVLIARAIEGRLRAGSLLRLQIDDLPPIEARLSRDRAQLQRIVGRPLTRLLERIGRSEAYQLEATAWPQTALRETYSDLASLGRDLHVEIDFCCVPTPGVLLLVAWLDDPIDIITSIDVFHGDRDIPFERRLWHFERPDGPPGDRDRRRSSSAVALLLPFDEAVVEDEDFVLLLATLTGLWTRSLKPRARLERGLRVLEQRLRSLEPNAQLMILEALAALTRGRGPAGEQMLLQTLQSAAVAALPTDITRGDLGGRLSVDLACTLGSAGVFLLGWALLEPTLVHSIEFCTTTGAHREISRDWVTHPRLDVWQQLREDAVHARSDRLGFLCFVAMPIDPAMTGGYLLLRWRNDLTLRMRVTLYFSAEDPLDAIKPVLTAFAQTHHDLQRLLDRHVGPAVTAVWSQRRGGPTAVDVIEHGTPPAHPAASVVIPLFGRCDLMEFQIASFANDPDMAGHEVIYVIDDPLIYDEARLLALDTARLYRFPFRLVYGRRNLGFSGATNLGASLARGRAILMMNSDVMPRRTHWLSDLARAHAALPQAGAAAPVLLYDDGSLQHAGMVFARYPLWANMWVNEHPGKGLPPLPMAAPFECIAVTGACLMIDADLWREVGGLSDEFIIGDFEDSDLCMRLLARGRRNWVVPAVELTHLERQSQDLIGDAAWRTNLSLFNCWTHHRKWNAAIVARLEPPGGRP